MNEGKQIVKAIRNSKVNADRLQKALGLPSLDEYFSNEASEELNNTRGVEVYRGLL